MRAILFFLSTLLVLNGYGQTSNSKPLRRFLQTASSPASTIPYGNNPKAGKYANVGDAKIYYEVYGKGKPVLVLHGGMFGSTYEMGQFIDSLSKRFQVIAVSTRGHGKSELGTVPHTYEQKAKDAYTVINAITKDSVTVLGFSDGGYTAFQLAALYPEKVKKMIVIGASETSPGVRTIKMTVKEAVAIDSLYWKQQLSLMPEPDRLQEMFDQVSNNFNNMTVGKDLLGKIKCPSLIMAGDRDASNTIQRVVNTAQMIPKSSLGIIPNTTHGVFLENFPAVWTSIVPFIEK